MNLTAMELAILKHLANGETNKFCASELKVGRGRIEQLRARIHRKLGVFTIAELTHAAIRLGIVPLKTK
jgi:DNA-binding CsgD family transcriptional regulator